MAQNSVKRQLISEGAQLRDGHAVVLTLSDANSKQRIKRNIQILKELGLHVTVFSSHGWNGKIKKSKSIDKVLLFASDPFVGSSLFDGHAFFGAALQISNEVKSRRESLPIFVEADDYFGRGS